MKICVTCGSPGPLEKHHVGGRKHSKVTTMLCVPCHFYCTIADVYERCWRENEPMIARLWAGVMDIWNRFADCNDLDFTATDVLNDAEYRGIFHYRPSSAIAKHVDQATEDTLPDQLNEIARLVREVVSCCES